MSSIVINGREMTVQDIVDHIAKSGRPVTAESVRKRIRNGKRGAALLKPGRLPAFTVTIDGDVLGPAELSDWLQESRGYFVGATTLRARMENGDTGERLLRPSRQKRNPHLTWGDALVRVSVPGWGVAV